MVEKPNDMDRMALYDVIHAIGNEMCTHNGFDFLNPNEIASDAMNIQAESIRTCQL